MTADNRTARKTLCSKARHNARYDGTYRYMLYRQVWMA